MLENIKGKGRKQSSRPADGAASSTGDAAGLAPPAASVASREGYVEQMQSSKREEHIALAAYYKAQQRGFQGGSPMEDWLAAEREFDAAYLARTMGQQDDEP
jgi:hypothetical protein